MSTMSIAFQQEPLDAAADQLDLADLPAARQDFQPGRIGGGRHRAGIRKDRPLEVGHRRPDGLLPDRAIASTRRFACRLRNSASVFCGFWKRSCGSRP